MSVAFDLHPALAPDLDVLLTSLAEDPDIRSWRVDVDREGEALVTQVTLRFHDSGDDEPAVCIRLVDGEGERSCSVVFAPDVEPHGAVFRAQSPVGAASSMVGDRLGQAEQDGYRQPFPLMSMAELKASDDHG